MHASAKESSTEPRKIAAPASIHRSGPRSAMVSFRCSREDRALLRQMADAEGISVQAYLERVVFKRPHATDLPPGPVMQKPLLPLDEDEEPGVT